MARPCARLAVTAGLLAATALAAAACSTTTAAAPACPTSPAVAGLAVAVGDRANSPQPAWPAQLDAQLATVTRAAGTREAGSGTGTGGGTGVTFVRVDGKPAVGCVMAYDSDAANGSAQQYDSQAFTAAVGHEAATLRADNGQADPLAALSLASAAAGRRGTVVLMDSGLQTVPPLNFAAADLLDASISSVVAQLRTAGELPQLSGQTVILDGIGYTAAPQPPLDQDQRDDLIELWQQIATAAGAARVQVVRTPNTGPAAAGLPAVSIVAVPSPDNVLIGCNQESVLSDDGAVGFQPGSTTFRNPAAADPVLARIASWLRRHPTARAALTGSIAHYPPDRPGGLSLERARAIAAALIRLGAGAGQITAAGAGWGPFPSPSAAPNPVSDPLNRRVVVKLTCP
jgi:OmpA-OmpF porin, OOP family